MGCKRILLSSDWYPALTSSNVTVTNERIAEATESGLRFADGSEIELAVLIYGTGFRTREFVAPRLRVTGASTIEVKPEAHQAFMTELRRRQRQTVWSTGGCSSWCADDQGRDPTNWPGYTIEYRRRVTGIDPAVYELGPPVPI